MAVIPLIFSPNLSRLPSASSLGMAFSNLKEPTSAPNLKLL